MKYEVCYEVHHYEVRLYDTEREIIGAREKLETEEDAVEYLKKLHRMYPDYRISLFRIENANMIYDSPYTLLM